MDTFERLKDITENVLGSPKHEYSGSGGWYEYNCPHCTDENGGVEDGKHNLAVTYEEGQWFHCWKCGYSGKISSLIKKYGNITILSDYRNEISSIKERSSYTLSSDDVIIGDDDSEITGLTLPDGFRRITDDSSCFEAKQYLKSRGIDKNIIDFYSIGYIGNEYRRDFSLKNRIILQSHNIFGELNFWVGRDYTGKNKVKYKNVDIEKKEIIFDEDKINWYEPITLVEGPFDHIVVPNSIPLLGKTIGPDYAITKALTEKCKSTVNIFLDDDAYANAIKAYRFLNSTTLNGRVRLIECPTGMDAADIFKENGRGGILEVLKTAKEINEIDLLKI